MSNDRKKALDAALSQIDKQFGKGSAMTFGQRQVIDVDVIPTGSLNLDLALGVGGYIWFWGKPVGVNNYINKATLQLVVDSPEILTYMGMVDNTPLDFHSGKLASYTLEQEQKSLEKTKKARKALDKYGPAGLEGQELLSWKITAWFLDDLIRQSQYPYSNYPVNQISGPTVDLPQFLTDTHTIKNKKSVELSFGLQSPSSIVYAVFCLKKIFPYNVFMAPNIESLFTGC